MMFTATELMSLSARALFAKRRLAKLAIATGVVLGSLLTCQSSHAAPINYGTFMGNTVSYVDVTEDSNSGDALPLFGPPAVSGDSMDFNPVGFDANSSGGGADITDGNLKFGVYAKPGFAIKNLLLNEAGDTTIAGFGDNGTLTRVTADGVLNISEVDGVGIGLAGIPISLTFIPLGGSYQLGDLGGGPFFHTQWGGSLFLNLNQILTANSVPFTTGATKISINLDNTLTAVSQAGTTALIAKKDFGGMSITINVPEPASFVLAGLGLLGFVATRRRSG